MKAKGDALIRQSIASRTTAINNVMEEVKALRGNERKSSERKMEMGRMNGEEREHQTISVGMKGAEPRDDKD